MEKLLEASSEHSDWTGLQNGFFFDLKNRANICQAGAGAAGAISRLNGALRAAEDSPGLCSSCPQSLVFCSAVYELA